MNAQMPFGRWRGWQLCRAPTAYLLRLRRAMDRHCTLRWKVAAEINRRRITAKKEG